jgi:molecular chaperone GrpE
MNKTAKKDDVNHAVAELTQDLQRVRADFENYRKRVESEKQAARENGEAATIRQILPILDTIDRAVADVPADIQSHVWVQGVQKLVKQLDSLLAGLSLERIPAGQDTVFNPDVHQAVQFDEDSTGETEIITEQLQAGYLHKGKTLRPAMVKAARR